MAIGVDRKEEQKRQAVLVKPRHTVLIKIAALQGIKVSKLGLERRERDDQAIEAKHTAEAQSRGLDPNAYRSNKTDTGYNLVRKGEYRGVRIGRLLGQLRDLGLLYVGGYWSEVEGNGPVLFLNFSTEGEEVQIPAPVQDVLSRISNDIVVWCNLKYGPDDSQYRLDTINLACPYTQEGENSWELVIPEDHPNTYRLI